MSDTKTVEIIHIEERVYVALKPDPHFKKLALIANFAKSEQAAFRKANRRVKITHVNIPEKAQKK